MYKYLSKEELKNIEQFVSKKTPKYYNLVSYIEQLFQIRQKEIEKEIKKKILRSFENLMDDKYLEKGITL